MFTFLPKEQKKKLAKDYRIRVFVTFFMMLFFAVLISCILLVPSYLFSRLKMQSIDLEAKKATSAQVISQEAVYESEIKNVSEYLTLLAGKEDVSLWKVIEKFTANKGNISISSFNINKKTDNTYEVSMTGKALRREDLATFSKNLRSNTSLSEINLPVSDFARTNDIIFRVSFIVNL